MYLDKAVVKKHTKNASGDGLVDVPFRLRRLLYQGLCRRTRRCVEPDLQWRPRASSCVCRADIRRTQNHQAHDNRSDQHIPGSYKLPSQLHACYMSLNLQEGLRWIVLRLTSTSFPLSKFYTPVIPLLDFRSKSAAKTSSRTEKKKQFSCNFSRILRLLQTRPSHLAACV